ncbi:MAG: hypothetical protein ACK4S4_10985 [Pyrinomonadaceae bacterium]
MSNEKEKDEAASTEPVTADTEDGGTMSGFSQFIVGEIETIGGVLTGDPLTRAEGEFNVEVGTIREEIEEELDDDNSASSDEGGEK